MMHWFVASVTVKPDTPRRTRTWGYFRELDNAIQHVQDTVPFYSERGYYTHVVLEGIPAADALGERESWTREEIWFELDWKTETATRVDKPEGLERIINFTLG
jgi:hypothetical protein